ncbi:MAG: T9SS type A sorting domain-containing protein [Candidatus Latescibacteria bacterium]|nr:T9SS type A sorting domain-containing protein [Candidatus Latescibacterota bacterium]
MPAKGQVHVLVIFAQFAGEAPALVPDFADHLFDPDHPGSFAHFYRAMSFGQLQVHGTALPRRYAADRPVSSGSEGLYLYRQFVLEILKQVDADLDFGLFDNDGLDGVPNSGDDDGLVDYVFLNLCAVPRGFILGNATGVAGLGFEAEYLSADTSSGGQPIRLSGTIGHGALLQEGTFSQTVGSMAHEFGHGLGLPDLYDLTYTGPEDDSAGIGRWGLMGWGAHGWNGDDGPNPLCAWSREMLGWIGADNERLVEVQGDAAGLEILDLHRQGSIYKIPLSARKSGVPLKFYTQDYLLLEHRVRHSNYYNRDLPSEGLLVWYIRPTRENNNDEERKLVELVCADEHYADVAGESRDGLNLWAHDEEYARAHAGNQGDATDPFDGVRFTDLAIAANPAAAATGLAIRQIRRQGDALYLDILQPRWAGTLPRGEVYWTGEVIVEGDLIIAPKSHLVIYPNTQVRIAGVDRLKSGLDPARCELRVQGEVRVYADQIHQYQSRYRREPQADLESRPPVLAALVPGESWGGLLLEGAGRVRAPEGSLVLRDTDLAQPTAVLAESKSRPAGFQLLPNFPNPFNSGTVIRFDLPEGAAVELSLYDLAGQKVATLVGGWRSAGTYQVRWDARNDAGQPLASGVYFYQLRAGDRVESRRLLVLR